MRTLTKREQAVVSLLQFAGVDYATLHITRTGLSKGYTDATVIFRDFLKRTGIHNFSLQKAGEGFIEYLDVFGLTAKGEELLKISLQRPATKGGRMFRMSMLGGLKGPLQISDGDMLIFSVRDNQLLLANLTQLADRAVSHEGISAQAKPEQGAAILTIAKNRILFVMESIPECEAKTGSGVRPAEIAKLTGMLLQKHPEGLVNALLDELCFKGRIEPTPSAHKKFRLCR